MKLWNKVKKYIRQRAEEIAQEELVDCLLEGPYGREFPSTLKTRKERIEYKKNLTDIYTYQLGDDVLSKKQDFIDQYTVNEREQFSYFIKNNPLNCHNKTKTHVWHNYEQVERKEAQKAWRQVAKRNYHAHMRQKFMNQKTR